MARPITWQDVAAPQQGAALLAAQNAGRDIAGALGDIGDTGLDWRNRVRDEATRAAVADIQNAANPLAAAAAAPQGWQVDPLAVAGAAQKQANVLQDRDAGKIAIAASRASIDRDAAALEDIISTREAEAIAQRNWDTSRKSGSVKFSGDDVDKSGQAYVKAGAILEGRLNSIRDDARADAQLRLQTDRVAEDKRLTDFQGAVYSLATSKDGLLMDPAERPRKVEELAKQFNVSTANVPAAMSLFDAGIKANAPTQTQFENVIPGKNFTYKDVGQSLIQEASEINAKREIKLNEQALASGGAAVMETSPFKGKSGTELEQTLHTILKDEDFSFGDVQTRLRKMRSAFPNIHPDQAAQMVVASQDRFLDWTAARSPEAKAMAAQFAALNKAGGIEGHTRRIGEINSSFDSELAKVQRAGQELQGSARLGEDLFGNTKAVLDARAKREEAEADAKQKVINDAIDRANELLKKRDKARDDVASGLAGGFSY